MQNMLILGVNGGLAKVAIQTLLVETDAHLTLFLRNAKRLAHLASERVSVVEGDVMNLEQLTQAMVGKILVYANLAGNLEPMAKNIVQAGLHSDYET
ncbi:NAD(P)H-binding protein [Actinobacillus vicugnae]|uniref:NAD(P)H-binding protein n=1 Tax=Actinobacillus vicugnae TaxID=2573093 RepID=UPI001240E75E|nr:NAD(P)H-binding protein [Actinobacillus vicugnae]